MDVLDSLLGIETPSKTTGISVAPPDEEEEEELYDEDQVEAIANGNKIGKKDSVVDLSVVQESLEEDENKKRKDLDSQRQESASKRLRLKSEADDFSVHNLFQRTGSFSEMREASFKEEERFVNIYPHLDSVLKISIQDPLSRPNTFGFAQALINFPEEALFEAPLPLQHLIIIFGAKTSGKSRFVRSWTKRNNVELIEIRNEGAGTHFKAPYACKPTVYLLSDMLGFLMSEQGQSFYALFSRTYHDVQQQGFPVWFIITTDEVPVSSPQFPLFDDAVKVWSSLPAKKMREGLWACALKAFSNNKQISQADFDTLVEASANYTSGQIFKFVHDVVRQFLSRSAFELLDKCSGAAVVPAQAFIDNLVYTGASRRLTRDTPEGNYRRYDPGFTLKKT